VAIQKGSKEFSPAPAVHKQTALAWLRTSSSPLSLRRSTAVLGGTRRLSQRSTTTVPSACRTATSPALPNMTTAKGVTQPVHSSCVRELRTPPPPVLRFSRKVRYLRKKRAAW